MQVNNLNAIWQQFIFEFRAGTDTLSQTYTVIYCKHFPDISAATLANSNYITNYFTRLVYRGAKDLLPYLRVKHHNRTEAHCVVLKRCGLPAFKSTTFAKVVDLGGRTAAALTSKARSLSQTRSDEDGTLGRD